MNKLKVGVIIDNGIDSPLLDHLVFESSKTNKFIVKAIIKQSTPKADSSFYKKVVFLIKSRGIKRFLRDVSFKFLEFVEFKLFKSGSGLYFFQSICFWGCGGGWIEKK